MLRTTQILTQHMDFTYVHWKMIAGIQAGYISLTVPIDKWIFKSTL